MRVKEDKRRDRFLATHLDVCRYIAMILFAKKLCTQQVSAFLAAMPPDGAIKQESLLLSIDDFARLTATNSDQIQNPKARIVEKQNQAVAAD